MIQKDLMWKFKLKSDIIFSHEQELFKFNFQNVMKDLVQTPGGTDWVVLNLDLSLSFPGKNPKGCM